jgi:hypothetical protein
MGGLVLPQAKTQQQHNNPTNRQQNHTRRPQLIHIHTPSGLGTPPVSSEHTYRTEHPYPSTNTRPVRRTPNEQPTDTLPHDVKPT